MQNNLTSVPGWVCIKIAALPLLGLALFIFSEVTATDYMPGLILLSTPTATVAYVMHKEMHGAGEFAVGAISAGMIFSIITCLIWLTVVGGN